MRNCRDKDKIETHMGSDPGCTIVISNKGKFSVELNTDYMDEVAKKIQNLYRDSFYLFFYLPLILFLPVILSQFAKYDSQKST